MKILVVSPDHPYPPNHGGRVDIWNRILLLSELNCIVDIVITTPKTTLTTDEESEFRRQVRNVTFCERKKKLLPFLLGIPYQVSSRASLKKFESPETYDYIILESEATSEILKSPTIKGAKKLLRVHNNESTYYKSLFKTTNSKIKKLYYLYESVTYRRHSERTKLLADKILHISNDELLAETITNRNKSIFLPPYINFHELKEIKKSTSHKVVYVGNLFTANNLNGLQWFVDFVHPMFKNSDYELIIAGNTRGNPTPITNMNQPNITFIDSPKDLRDIYEEASVFIIPLLEGAGVKLRAINAISEGIAIVATSTGIEGLGLENQTHYLLGDTPEAFYKSITDLLNSEDKRTKLAKNAQQHMINNLDSRKILSTILQQPKHECSC
ncbi:hypothetical protein B6D87_09580 [Pseudomonas fragi]|uniref:glycosyltransferase family 4 protein n=1 Tax=Pseudomonas fragi TaxID=296 RepID=UPI000A2A1829|nr:glycosyltransferase family 4 protein [Pseudomonas fragi]ARQ74449.1 hypothetical protein B6D87_09580 [Pseudomonas fragi]